MSRILGLDTKSPPFEIIVMGRLGLFRRARAIRGVVHVHIDDAECESEDANWIGNLGTLNSDRQGS